MPGQTSYRCFVEFLNGCNIFCTHTVQYGCFGSLETLLRAGAYGYLNLKNAKLLIIFTFDNNGLNFVNVEC